MKIGDKVKMSSSHATWVVVEEPHEVTGRGGGKWVQVGLKRADGQYPEFTNRLEVTSEMVVIDPA